METAIRNLLLCINGRFRINELTRLVPAPVRSVLRNDDSFLLDTHNKNNKNVILTLFRGQISDRGNATFPVYYDVV